MSRGRKWDESLTLTVPLDPQGTRYAYLIAPSDGLTESEGERVATVIRAWTLKVEHDQQQQ